MSDRDLASVTSSIGELNERSLHAALKAWCSQPGDLTEVTVDGYVVDVVRGDLLIEVQTGGIGSIKNKLSTLAFGHDMRLLYPVVAEKMIRTLDGDGQTVLRQRRSPARLGWASLFDELVYCPHLLTAPRLELVAVKVAVTEVRCADGTGSWRRKGIRIVDTLLDRVLETRTFRSAEDLLDLLPPTLEEPFTHRDLAAALGVRMATAQRASYCLRHLGLLREVGRRGHALLIERVPGATIGAV